MDENEEPTKVELLEELAALRRQVQALEALSARAEQVEDEYCPYQKRNPGSTAEWREGREFRSERRKCSDGEVWGMLARC